MTATDRLEALVAQIHDAAASAQRSAADITLIGVAKAQPLAAVEAAAAAGLRHIGVNYLQEGLAQQAALAGWPVTWHFIGAIQTNKTRPIAEHFGAVHTVDRQKVAERLSSQRSSAPLDVLLQVNVDAEATKAGADTADLEALAAQVAALPNLRLRGLMAIPRPSPDADVQRRAFARVRQLRDALASRLRAAHPLVRLDWLSMGMSGDFRAAILEGATHIRVGTALFGARGATP